MKVKALEIRDDGTFIPALAIDMNPGEPYPSNGSLTEDELRASLDAHGARFYLLRRCGYRCDGRPNIILTRLDGNGMATNDPYEWPAGSMARTFGTAHHWIIEHWNELKDGDVVDVEFILGLRDTPKLSERVTA